MDKTADHTIRVSIRFYGDLNELLFSNYPETIVERTLSEPTSVKDLIEGCGVPHTEVDLILVDHEPVEFSFLIDGNEFVSVYPFFKSMDIPDAQRLQITTLKKPRFLVDVNLGKLARYLRIAGFDTVYENDLDDDELIKKMLDEKRVLLTRDRKLLMHNVVESGYFPRSQKAHEQLEEVFNRFDLFNKVNPYSRCIHCNGILKSVPKVDIIDQLEPLTKKHFDQFSQCPGCGQIYWPGSHRERLHSKIRKILKLD